MEFYRLKGRRVKGGGAGGGRGRGKKRKRKKKKIKTTMATHDFCQWLIDSNLHKAQVNFHRYP